MSLATINGASATLCRVSLPAWGAWWAEVETSGPDALAPGAAATIVLDDLTLRGTVVTGGAYQTRVRYRIVAGAGGWGRSVAARSYANDLGVKASLILRDVAAEVGETLGTVPATAIGPAYVRAEGPATRVLDWVAPRGWYVDEAGVTQVGRRPAVTFTGQAARMVNDASQVRYEIAPDAGMLSTLMPGVVVDGVEAVDVEHELDAEGRVRTTLWGRGVADTSRLSEALRRIVEAFTAGSRFYGVWEYRIVQTSGADRVDLQAVRVSSGMPDLRHVPSYPGATYADGAPVTPSLGSTCLVAFLNGDPSRPQIIARAGDPVLVGASALTTAAVVAGGNPVTATRPILGRIGVGG